MPKLDYLSLVGGQDIILKEFGVVVRQPKVKEISMIGEQEFYRNCYFLLVSKDTIVEQISASNPGIDIESIYADVPEYEIVFNTISEIASAKNGMFQIFELLFPEYKISIEEIGIFFMKEGAVEPVVVRPEQFELLRDYLKQILCLNPGSRGEEEYNTESSQAEAIANKLRARKKKLDSMKEKNKSSNILGNYVSSLGIGSQSYTIDKVVDLSLFQLFDQIKRFGQWTRYDISLRAKTAGAKDVDEVNWMEELE